MYADSEHEAQRLRWQVDQRRIQQATEAMAAIQDRPLNPVLRRWIETDRKALVLYGPSGYGKTTQIKALMTAYVRHHHQSVVYYTEAGAYNALTQFEHKEEVAKVRARIQSASLLVIDDYGTAAASDYRSELLYELVDHVYRTGRRIIVATNLDEEKMWGRADDRVNRRLRDMCGKALAMPTIWAGVARAERPARAMDDNG
jgi:DNA replication protein DnaC